jgi:chromate reductase, NAD(P)H dehydrogenase (quinone)
MTRLLFFPGSLRAQASSTALLQALAARLPEGVAAETADIGALPHYNADHDGGAPVATLLAQVKAADGVVFVTPEYNYSVPGVLKNAIDWASRPGYNSVFKGKPCPVVTTSAGALGGVRAQGHLKQILSAMLSEVFPWQDIVVPFAPKKLSDGIFTDAEVLDFAGTAMAAFLDRCGAG